MHQYRVLAVTLVKLLGLATDAGPYETWLVYFAHKVDRLSLLLLLVKELGEYWQENVVGFEIGYPRRDPDAFRYLVHFASLRSELAEWEILRIFDVARIGYFTDSLLALESAELLIVEGNTIRKCAGASVSTQLAQPRETSVQVFIEGSTTNQDTEELLIALEDWLEELVATVRGMPVVVQGSILAKLVFLLKVGDYAKTLSANLHTAFGMTTTNQRVAAVERLAAILARFPNTVVKIDSFIAVKVTRNRQSFVVIKELTPGLRKRLELRPDLESNPHSLYEFIQNNYSPAVSPIRLTPDSVLHKENSPSAACGVPLDVGGEIPAIAQSDRTSAANFSVATPPDLPTGTDA